MLRDSLKKPSVRARIAAARGLGKMGTKARDSASALLPLLHQENKAVRDAAAAALGKIGAASEEIVSELLELAPGNNHPFYPSKRASAALVRIGLAAVPYLVQILRVHGNRLNSIGEAAQNTLAQIGEPALPHLAEVLKSGDDRSKVLIAHVISRIKFRAVAERHAAAHESILVLIQMLGVQQDIESAVKIGDVGASAADALGSLGDPIAGPALIEALKDPNFVCVCAARALARIKYPLAVVPLITVVEDQHKFWVPRGAAAVALGNLGQIAQPALPALRRALKYNCVSSGGTWDRRARQAVKDAIAHISDPKAACLLKGKGYRFEMWGIY